MSDTTAAILGMSEEVERGSLLNQKINLTCFCSEAFYCSGGTVRRTLETGPATVTVKLGEIEISLHCESDSGDDPQEVGPCTEETTVPRNC